MKSWRTVPPAAAPIGVRDVLHGLGGMIFRTRLIKRLEMEVRQYFGVRYVFLVSSGKAGLTLILMALKRLSGKRGVVIPAYDCFSVPSAILQAGLEIVPCDVNPRTLDYDYKLLGDAIRDDVLCVIPTHILGIPSNVNRINQLCRERGVYVVEDAAQAMGGDFRGSKLGTLGDVGFFSLGRGKNITSGSGGIIVTNSEEIAEAIKAYYMDLGEPSKLHDIVELIKILFMCIFIHPNLFRFPSGVSFLGLGKTIFDKEFPVEKMSGMKAGLLWNWKNKLKGANRRRCEAAAYFMGHFGLDTNRQMQTPYLRLPVLFDSVEIRDKILEVARRRGLGISHLYPSPISEIGEIKSTFGDAVFPFAQEVVDRIVTLPTHHLLSRRDREAIRQLIEQESVAIPHIENC